MPGFDQIRGTHPIIAPSMLLCDFANLEREVHTLEKAGTEVFHLDVMDGHFVPNITYGMTIVQAVRQVTDRTIDAHLMISEPERYVEQFIEAGANQVTFHVEAVENPRPLLEKIRSLGAGGGIALNPDTPLSAIENYLDVCNVVLVMSVQPGFGGQKFKPVGLQKLRRLRTLVGKNVYLEIDGGVNQDSIAPCVEAGANVLVVGSAIFGHADYAAQVKTLNQLAQAKGAATEK